MVRVNLLIINSNIYSYIVNKAQLMLIEYLTETQINICNSKYKP